MAISLSFQCKTCRQFFEWTDQFRRPTNGADICSECLAAWNSKQASKLVRNKVRTQRIKDLVSRRENEKKRLSWARAQARREEERAKKKAEKSS